MANLVEVSQWEAGVYQYETSDPVEGGPDGIDNVQGRQLGNRTRYLKDQLEAHAAAVNPHPQYATIVQMQAAISALVAAAPGALDTLKELADALGDDPNFATTMTNALALKAALDSPIFTGAPKAPLPAQFDSSPLLAPTSFVQRALGNFSNQLQFNTSQTISLAQAGALIVGYGTATIGFTLPPAASVPQGTAYWFWSNNTSSGGVTLACNGSDLFQMNSVGQGTIAMKNGDSLFIVKGGTNQWIVFGGSLQLGSTQGFAATLGSSGYQKLPSGLIIQFGLFTSSSSGYSTLTLPVSAPNGIVSVTGTSLSSSSTAGIFMCNNNASSKSSVQAAIVNTSNAYVTQGIFWTALTY